MKSAQSAGLYALAVTVREPRPETVAEPEPVLLARRAAV